MDNTIVIDKEELKRVTRISRAKFNDYRSFNNIDPFEIQMLLLLDGFRDYLISNGIDPNFKIKLPK